MARKFNLWGRPKKSVDQLCSNIIASEFYQLRGVVTPVSHRVTEEGCEFTIHVASGNMGEFIAGLERLNKSGYYR